MIYIHYIRKPHDVKKRYGKNSYVIITEATNEIGKSFSEFFAKEGLNLILVSNNTCKLTEISNNLKSKISSKIDIKIIEFDFANKLNINEYEKAFNEYINNYDISILINNAELKEYNNNDNEVDYNIISVNIIAQSYLSNIIGKKMKLRNNTDTNNRDKKHSLIINLSSFIVDLNIKYNSLYFSTKAYNDHFSRVCSEEFSHYNSNIDVISLKPLYLSNHKETKTIKEYISITTDELVNSLKKSFGYEAITYGHIKHQLIGDFLKTLPDFLTNSILSHIIN